MINIYYLCRHLFLTGYEKETIEEFIEKAKRENIDVVIDVREIPLSRKSGFSKAPQAYARGILEFELRSSRILFALLFNVFSDDRFVPSHGRNEVAIAPYPVGSVVKRFQDREFLLQLPGRIGFDQSHNVTDPQFGLNRN